MNDFQSKSLLAVSMLAILSLSPLSVAQQGQTPQTQPPAKLSAPGPNVLASNPRSGAETVPAKTKSAAIRKIAEY